MKIIPRNSRQVKRFDIIQIKSDRRLPGSFINMDTEIKRAILVSGGKKHGYETLYQPPRVYSGNKTNLCSRPSVWRSLRLYLNYCQSTRKRKAKIVNTASGQQRKLYFEAKTSYQRLMAMEDSIVSPATKAMLQSEYNNLNPVKLLAEIQSLLNELNVT